MATGSVGLRAADWRQGEGFRFRELTPGEHAGGTSPRRQVGFTAIPGTASGVDFQNPLAVRSMMANNNLMNGSGVAAGDFDGDGWCDLYFAAIEGTNALYRNLGNWRFEDRTSAAGVGLPGARSTGALFVDLEADGDLDLLVATLGHGVRVFENGGDGRFTDRTATSGLAADTGSMSLAMGDVDGDGDPDLYVANYGSLSILRSGGRAELRNVDGEWQVTGPHAKRLRFVDGRLEELGEPDALYRNDGRGRFEAVPWDSVSFLDEWGKPKPAPWDFGLTVQIRDLNGDRAPDIYVCNDFQTVDRFWLNDGAGQFRLLPRLAMRKQSFSSMGVDFADLDRDGDLDFFVTEMMARDPRRWMRQIVGMPPLIPEPGRIDNRPEVARNTLFLNEGRTTFAEIALYSGVPAADWAWQPEFLDVDLDGFEDALVVNGMAFDVQDRDVLDHVRSLGRQSPEQSRQNLALYPEFSTADVAWRNRGDLTFEDTSAAWGFDNERISQGLAQADLDNDGDLDLAINGIRDGALLLRNESAAPRLAVRLRGRGGNPRGIGGSILVAGGGMPRQMQEILCGGHYLSCSDTMRVFAAGSLTNRFTIEVRWRGGATSFVRNARPNCLYEIEEPASAPPVSEPPADPEPEPWFADRSAWLNHTHRETLFPDYARQPLLTRQFTQLGPGVAWFDLDGDGRDELFLGAARGDRPGVFRWNGIDRFEAIPLPEWGTPDDLTGIVGWVRADGQRSILAALSRCESDVALPAGIAQFSGMQPAGLGIAPLAGVPATRESIGPLAAADFDRDGDLDLFVGSRLRPGAYPEPAPSRLFRQQPGGLGLDAANTAALGDAALVSGAVWSDLDADGWTDLVLACDWGPVRIFRNVRGTLQAWDPPLKWTSVGGANEPSGMSTLGGVTGWWNGVTTGDFDGDGRPDIVAANWGLNTPWRPSSAHPLRFYYGDLLDSGVTDIIESAYVPELGAEAPQRSLNALAQAFPMLLEHFPTHRTFANVTLPALLATLPNQAESVAATSLASMLFLNRGDHFEPQPLPREAQFAPSFSLNVADFDADGAEDLLLSQNFFALRPEIPRLDAGRGLLLRGDGRGGFTPLPADRSGISVAGEQRGAAVADFDADGRADLVVTQNGAATFLFQNQSPRRGLRVRLRGTRGNPDAVGAAVQLVVDGKPGPVREIHAGSGYWSQDSAVLVLAATGTVDAVRVRWPDGRRTTTAVPADADALTLNRDGSIVAARANIR
ncbi:MAG: VCBS repeat-containing protein [Verrucomicrobiales bacterium]|nr:VCBS repeat-containing protein [Verrucomicrobiales bacterium]MCP5525773.1 VCBS repeat-containing protein [Verrucomicrobiales bacterium]